MELSFFKYQGTGNDFILLDNRAGQINLTSDQIALLCDRRFGIGADGLMLLEVENGFDFRMVYFNSDGAQSTMCGNGGRCIVAFARKLGIVDTTATFVAIDGPHQAEIHDDGRVSLQMKDVDNIDFFSDHFQLDTGSPHYVVRAEDVKHLDVFQLGRSIRNEAKFQPLGINVNFMQEEEDHLFVRTYERGVEAETLSCGTGVTAAAIAAAGKQTGAFHRRVLTPGGMLEVFFNKNTPSSAKDIILKGPAELVFSGSVSL